MNVTGVSQVALIWDAVAKHYGPRRVWHELAGEVRHGEVLVISGPNGAGKSTLLRLFSGLETPSAGTIHYEWQGRSQSPVAMRPWLGLVAPDIALYRELTALEHLRFVAKVRGLPADEPRWRSLLTEVGLDTRGDEQVAGFSSGMALRLKYALALLHSPPVLLLDEPTAMFDAAGRAFVAALIERQRAQGIVIVATNDPAELSWGDLILAAG